MSTAVITFVVFGWMTPAGSSWDAWLTPRLRDFLAELIAIVSFVCNDLLFLGQHDFFRRDQIVALSGSQGQLEGSPFGIDQSRDFAIEPTLGAAKTLIFLPSSRVGRILVNFHVRGIQMAQRAFRIFGQDIQYRGPQAAVSPARPSRINRTPRTKMNRKVSPRAAGPENVNHRFDHQAVILGRPPRQYLPGFSKPITLIFLAASKAGPAKSNEN
jgi:hypothetical protein